MSTVKQLCAECQQERKQFAAYGENRSPGCAALWRLAFTKDADAWACVKAIFEPWVERLGFVAINQAPKISGLSQLDLPDLVQDVWHNLWRYMVRNRADALKLVVGDDIRRVIGLIKTTTKNRVVELCRKPRGYEEPLPDDEPLDNDGGPAARSPVGRVDPPEVEGILDLLAFLQRHIKTEQERCVAEVIFLRGMKPQDVVDLCPKLFGNVKVVNQVHQNLLRRLRTDPARRNLGGFASLQYRLDTDEVLMPEKQNLFEPCPFDEDILVNYINGHVDAAVKATIEHSPACLEAVNRLKADLAEWRPYLRKMFCPDNEKLVAYQEHRLESTLALLVHNHVQQCPFCRAEVDLLAAMDAIPDVPSSWVRRLYELIFQPAPLAPVPTLGEGSYRTIERTPQIELLVRTNRTTGKQRNWLLMGRLRYEDEQPFTQVESIIIQDIEDPEAPALSATLDEMGTFSIKGLDAGLYRIHILLPGEEIILHEFRIGDRY